MFHYNEEKEPTESRVVPTCQLSLDLRESHFGCHSFSCHNSGCRAKARGFSTTITNVKSSFRQTEGSNCWVANARITTSHTWQSTDPWDRIFCLGHLRVNARFNLSLHKGGRERDSLQARTDSPKMGSPITARGIGRLHCETHYYYIYPMRIFRVVGGSNSLPSRSH